MAQYIKTKKVKDSDIWSELKKSWRSYKVAKLADDKNRMKECALKIKELQERIGAKISDFPELKT